MVSVVVLEPPPPTTRFVEKLDVGEVAPAAVDVDHCLTHPVWLL